MGTLHIHLQEGFDGDEVVILAAGDELYRNAAARTQTQIGLAEMTEVEVPDGDVEVTIRVPGRQLSTAVRLPVNGANHLGISLADGGIETRISPDGFGYL